MFEQMFNMSKIGDFLDTLATAASQKSAAAKETAVVATDETERVAQSAAKYNEQATQALEVLNKVQEDQKRSAAMAEGGIFDRIALIGDQIINPREYTREGRTNQVAEASQALAMRGQIHNVEVTTAQANIDAAKSRELLKTADASANMESLRLQIDGLNLANQAFAQTETLRQNNLSQLDLPTLQKSLIGPPGPNGKITLGDMPYTRLEIQDRARNLELREKVALLSPQASNPEYANLLRNSHDLQLATYGIDELNTLKTNGFILPDGTQVEPTLFDQHWDRVNLRMQQDLTERMNQEVLHNQIPMMLQDGTHLSQNIQKQATPGSPLAIANTNYIAELATAAKLAESDVTPNGKIMQVQRIQQAQEKVTKAVAEEAKRRAGGDSDLASIYQDQILGTPLQPAKLEGIMVERYIARKGMGAILPQDVSIRVQATADKELLRIRQEQAQNEMSMMSGGVKLNEKDMREQAVRKAFEIERSNAGVQGINMIQIAATKRKDNPAAMAGMIPGQIDEKQKRAVVIADNRLVTSQNLTPQELNAIHSGPDAWAAAGISPQRGEMLTNLRNAEAVAAEYELYEAYKPGLGYEVQQWYNRTLPEMARNYGLSRSETEQAFIGNAVLEEAQKFNDTLIAIDESATDRGQQMIQEAATGAKVPENMWPVLLQMDSRLADSEKAMVYRDVIEPVITQSRAIGQQDSATITANIFEALKNFKSDDSVMNSSVKTFMRNLAPNLDNFETMWTSSVFKGASSQPYARRASKSATEATKRIRSNIPWLQEREGR